MGHWEHRWFRDSVWTEWQETYGPINKASTYRELVHILSGDTHCMAGNHLPLHHVSGQLYASNGNDLQFQYYGELEDRHEKSKMTPIFDLEEIELAQKMIGQK